MKNLMTCCAAFSWLCIVQYNAEADFIPLSNSVVRVGQSVTLVLESPQIAIIYAGPAYDTWLGSGRTCINGFEIGRITNSDNFVWSIPTNLPVGFYRILAYDGTNQENQYLGIIDLEVKTPEAVLISRMIAAHSVEVMLSGGFEQETYILETSTNLQDWSEIPQVFAVGSRSATNNVMSDRGFFRAKLKNVLEISYSTIPVNPTKGDAVCFIGHAQGGNGIFEYVWTSSDCTTSTNNTYCEGYSPGDVLTFTVTSGQQRATIEVLWPQ